MPRTNIIITLGATIALLPLLGFPPHWESVFEVVAGLSIVGISIWGNIDKKLTLRAKAQRRQAHRRAMDAQSGVQAEDPVSSESHDESSY